jgi:hypothetical protein
LNVTRLEQAITVVNENDLARSGIHNGIGGR